jgi:hypothetical protein
MHTRDGHRQSSILILIGVLTTLCALAPAARADHPSPAAAGGAPDISMSGCLLSLTGIDDDPEHARSYLPARYRLLPFFPTRATLATWSYSCEGVAVGDSAPRPAQLSLMGIAIEKPDRPAGELPQPVLRPNVFDLAGPVAGTANYWDHYTVFVFSDDPRLVRRLQTAGFPAHEVPGMTFTRTVVPEGGLPAPLVGLATSDIDVPWRPSPWASRVTPPLNDPQPVGHQHNDSYWRDGPTGAAELEIHIPEAIDVLCMGPGGACGNVKSGERSQVASFLGGANRDAFGSVDHRRIERVEAFIRPAPSAPRPTAKRQPADESLRLSVRPKRVRAGRRQRLRFRATALREGRRRPVRGATIRLAGRRARTDRHGRASLVVRLHRVGRRRVTATLPGGATAATTIRVVRRAGARR